MTAVRRPPSPFATLLRLTHHSGTGACLTDVPLGLFVPWSEEPLDGPSQHPPRAPAWLLPDELDLIRLEPALPAH